jgi:Tol biopolymer transport system component
VIRTFVVSLVVALVSALPADAQYFGRNKVEYHDFDFRILETEHFDVYYYPREERAARIAAQLAERWYARFSTLLDHQFATRQPLVLYGSQAEFAQTNVVSGQLPDSVGGVTDASRRRITMPFAPTMAETNRVLGHEIVHAFQFDIARKHGGGTGQPLWFIEGMAEYLSRGSLDGESSLWLKDAVLNDRLPAKEGTAARQLSPYLYGHAFWAYLGNRFGDGVIEKALKPGKKQRRLKDRMRHATGEELDALYRSWRIAAKETYGARVAGARRLTPWTHEHMQLGPSLSPDGTQAVFFSERDRLSLDLFLADVKTGRVIRKLATTAASAKFDSLQPLRSAGAWSPDGRWFAFAAVRHGKAALMLIDMHGGRDREIVFDAIGQVLAPSWSPDGRAIVFSALAGGLTDLYLCNVADGSVERLTDDAFADLQPAWSHDGRTIAFVTERFSSDLAGVRFGRPRLAVMDTGTRDVRDVPIDASAQLSPQWSRDDDQLYFVGDPDGAMNVYRVGVETGTLHRITNVDTGVSGITPTSPALSVSGDASALAFTVYERGRPRLVVLDESASLEGERFAANTKPTVNADAESGAIDSYLADTITGLPESSTMSARAYRSRMSLEGVGQPYVTSGGGPFGTFVRGGGALLFGDMLGEKRFGAAVQIGNRMRDAAFMLRFLNQERRWNWGALAELQPSVARYRRSEAIEYDGQPALLQQADYLQRAQLRVAGVVAYPFSRGLRIEFTAGVRHAAYHRDLRSQIEAVGTGKVLFTDRVESRGGLPTTVAEVSAALVHDTTVFGPTGPLVGSRYRFEIAPAAGQLSYTSVTADFRQYVMPIRPYSIALRVLHSGRYGADGGDPRLLSNFLGSSYFVRGHRQDLRYCRPDATRLCGDDLLGSRLLVGNVELRVPLNGIRSRQLDYGMLPADLFMFLDGGRIWGQGSAAMISSVGGGLRVNAAGLPLELAAMRALDGPRPRWQFELGFRVGF